MLDEIEAKAGKWSTTGEVDFYGPGWDRHRVANRVGHLAYDAYRNAKQSRKPLRWFKTEMANNARWNPELAQAIKLFMRPFGVFDPNYNYYLTPDPQEQYDAEGYKRWKKGN